MDSKFWHECWKNKNLGFNQKSFNIFLKNFFQELSLDSNASILVPLCGKSIDLLWLLKQGYQVTGVELSPLAIKEFFEEHKIPFTKGSIGPYISWQAVDKNLLLLEGNFFDLFSLSKKEFKESHLQTLSAIYDRASLVALPKPMRIDYYHTLKKLLNPSTSLFLITVEYDQSKVDGPPFSVPEQEIREFLGENFAIKIRHTETQKSLSPRFLGQGVTSLKSKIYQLKKL
jgi:thiopurine S-methyltransferase